MRGGAKKGWRWRVADPAQSQRLNLLYEPGNWGDVLKGLWAVRVAASVCKMLKDKSPLVYLDPFAGAPTYPLVESASRRLEGPGMDDFRDLQAPYASRGLMASTAMLVRDAALRSGRQCELEVFDSDASRLHAWKEVTGVKVLEVPSGEDCLEEDALRRHAPDFLLVDPYDFFVKWTFFLPRALRAAEKCTVLAYLYNRSPRGPGQQQMYEDFRKALDEGLGASRGFLLGRIPADPAVARAYHEVLLLGPRPDISKLGDELAGPTRALARALADLGSFEKSG
jgi:hypothetical protein